MRKIFILICCFFIMSSISVSADEWIDYGNAKEIDLNYVWKVEFNKTVDETQFERVELSNFNGKVGTNVSFFENIAKISSIKNYLPGVDYVMKLYLKDGKKYKMSFATTENHDGEDFIHFIKVNDGRSILFQMPNGENVLMDSGTKRDVKMVTEYLRNLGIKQLDALILSDEDEFFSGGVTELMEFVPAKKIFIGNFNKNIDYIKDLKNWALERNVPIEQYGRGRIFEFGKASIKVLRGTEKKIDNSSVFLYSYDNMQSIVFGEIDDAGIQNLVGRHEISSIEMVCFFDNDISGVEFDFLEEIGLKYIVLQSNYSNPSGGVELESTDMLFNKYIVMYRPDIMGNIVYRSNGNRISWMTQPWVPHLSRGNKWSSKIVIEKIDRLKDEVYIKNYGEDTVELTNWYLKSNIGGEKYIFKNGKSIKAGERLIIKSHISKNFSSDDILNWTNVDIWEDNALDIGSLYDSRGNLISQYPYSW